MSLEVLLLLQTHFLYHHVRYINLLSLSTHIYCCVLKLISSSRFQNNKHPLASHKCPYKYLKLLFPFSDLTLPLSSVIYFFVASLKQDVSPFD